MPTRNTLMVMPTCQHETHSMPETQRENVVFFSFLEFKNLRLRFAQSLNSEHCSVETFRIPRSLHDQLITASKWITWNLQDSNLTSTVHFARTELAFKLPPVNREVCNSSRHMMSIMAPTHMFGRRSSYSLAKHPSLTAVYLISAILTGSFSLW